MKKTKTAFQIIFCFLLLVCFPLYAQKDAAKEWLREVEPIITKAEKTVFEGLKTQEDRTRFINSFWKVRDPNPETRENEYKLEYYKRLSYVKKYFKSTRSDQGRIYMILGEPTERNSYTGGEQVVDSEVWTYYSDNRPGLPPVMNLLFYRRENFGEFRLFYPGMDTTLDILSPGYRSGYERARSAYNHLRGIYAELADATLSVIPGEGHPDMPASATSSSHVFAQIYTLPEKEASDTYLRGFQSIEGVVDVTYSFKEMPGDVSIALSKNRGYTFLNYSIMPDAIRLRKVADNLHSARFNLNLRIEDLEGRTIYQQEKNIEFKLDNMEKQALDKKKIMFSGFVPVINGNFTANIVFSNKTTEEFLIHEERLEIDDNTVPVLLGFKIEEIQPGGFMPFSTDKHKISIDPRSVFNKTDSIKGIVFTEDTPDIRLISIDSEEDPVVVQDVVKQGRYYLFTLPLADVSSSNYYLSIETRGEEVYRKIVAVLPFLAEKPEGYEWTDPPTSGSAYNFEIATQYFNTGNIQKSLEYYNKLPESLWNSVTLPIIAKAYYRNKDYERVIELLEREDVNKDYSVLFLLGNSSLELKQLEKAAEYFEQLRNYGDTVKINQVLGAIFLSLGEREKAKTYFDRAKELENKPEFKKEKNLKEPRNEDIS
jgi:GWxTD domain-containing protein